MRIVMTVLLDLVDRVDEARVVDRIRATLNERLDRAKTRLGRLGMGLRKEGGEAQGYDEQAAHVTRTIITDFSRSPRTDRSLWRLTWPAHVIRVYAIREAPVVDEIESQCSACPNLRRAPAEHYALHHINSRLENRDV